jgi:hypothetical protein
MAKRRAYRVTMHGRLLSIQASSLAELLTELAASATPDDEAKFIVGRAFHIKAQLDNLATTSVADRPIPTRFMRIADRAHAVNPSNNEIPRGICGRSLPAPTAVECDYAEFAGDSGCVRCKRVYKARIAWRDP